MIIEIPKYPNFQGPLIIGNWSLPIDLCQGGLDGESSWEEICL